MTRLILNALALAKTTGRHFAETWAHFGRFSKIEKMANYGFSTISQRGNPSLDSDPYTLYSLLYMPFIDKKEALDALRRDKPMKAKQFWQGFNGNYDAT